MVRFQQIFIHFVREHIKFIRGFIIAICLLTYIVYLVFAVKHSLELARPVIIVTVTVLFFLLCAYVREHCDGAVIKTLSNQVSNHQKRWIKR